MTFRCLEGDGTLETVRENPQVSENLDTDDNISDNISVISALSYSYDLSDKSNIESLKTFLFCNA